MGTKHRASRAGSSSRRLADVIGRLGGMAFFGWLLIRRLRWYPASSPDWLTHAIWWGDLCYFALVLTAYVIRHQAKGRAIGFRERYLPWSMAALMFVFFDQPVRHAALESAALPVIFVGLALQCIGLWSLRRNFSVMVEARSLITTGVYRFMRHPLYVGGILCWGGGWLVRANAFTTTLYVLFILIEVYRAMMEEQKLQRFFPGYARYKQRVPMFGVRVPRLGFRLTLAARRIYC